MDVRCSRCSTDYEFDDTLISERGTTVKCTNCGHQFKVYPATSNVAPERWVVKTSTGNQIFHSLRELQTGIQKGHIGASDQLSRGGSSPRPLSSIAELEPFFKKRDASPSSGVPTPRTLYGVAPPANPKAGGHGPPSLQKPPEPNAPEEASAPANSTSSSQDVQVPDTGELGRWRMPGPPVGRIPTPNLGTINPMAATARAAEGNLDDAEQPIQVPPPVDVEPAGTSAASIPEPPTIPRQIGVTDPPAPAEPVEENSPAPPAVDAQAATIADKPATMSELRQAAVRSEFPTDPSPVGDELDEPARYSIPGRKARSRWIVAVVILGAGGLLSATVGRRYLEPYLKRPAAETASDGRVDAMLESGHKHLAEGDLEGAKEEFARASALAEHDSKVLVALASLEVARADLTWLKLKLLPEAASTELESSRRKLAQQLSRADAALKQASSAAPQNPAVIGGRVDLFRLKGDLKAARQNVGPLSGQAASPEAAYVLAALDLAEEEPQWEGVVQRLRTSLGGAGSALRGRPALIYALVRSGDVTEAQAELTSLGKSSPSHPLLIELRGLLDRQEPPTELEAPATGSAEKPEGTEEADEKAGDERLDFRAKLKLAAEAQRSGKLSRAESLYRDVIAEHPGNTEALSGLGDIAAQQGNSGQAAAYYDKVLALNPSYLPALMGSADQKWASGDRAGALKLYKRVVDQIGTGSAYGQRAKQRLDEASASKQESPELPNPEAQEKPAEPETAPPAAAPAEPDAPHIDTTDLPGFNE